MQWEKIMSLHIVIILVIASVYWFVSCQRYNTINTRSAFLEHAFASSNKITFWEHGNLHDHVGLEMAKIDKNNNGNQQNDFLFLQATPELQASKMSLLRHFAQSFTSTHTHTHTLGGWRASQYSLDNNLITGWLEIDTKQTWRVCM